MNQKQQKAIRFATFGIVAVNAIALVSLIASSFSVGDLSGFMGGLEFSRLVLAAALWPVMIAAAGVYSLRLYMQGQHYGWLGLITVSFLNLFSLAFPFAAVNLYILASPKVRAPMLKMLDEEWN